MAQDAYYVIKIKFFYITLILDYKQTKWPLKTVTTSSFA